MSREILWIKNWSIKLMNEDQWSASLKLLHYYSIINIHCVILNRRWLLKIINIMCHLDLLFIMQEKSRPTAVLWRKKGFMQILLLVCLILFFKFFFFFLKKNTLQLYTNLLDVYSNLLSTGVISNLTLSWKLMWFLQTTSHRNDEFYGI